MDFSEDDKRDVLIFAQQQAADAADLRLKVVFLERRLLQLERLLGAIHSSWTWRVGRVILFPVSLIRYFQRRQGKSR